MEDYIPWLIFAGVVMLIAVIGSVYLYLVELWQLSRMSREERDEYRSDQEKDSERTKKKDQIIHAVFCLVIVSVAFYGFWRGEDCSKRQDSVGSAGHEDEKAMAITMAQNFVRDRLKAPSTASFPSGFDEYRSTRSSDGTWNLSGWVEAINAFNAKLRVRWSVEMKREGANWKLLSINIQE